MTRIENSSRRRRLYHRLALRQRGDGGCPDRALLVVQKAFADRDAIGGVVIDHLEADPFLHWQAVQIQCDIAVDVAEALIARVREGAGEIRGQRDPHETRPPRGPDEGAYPAHPQPPGADRT